MVCKSGLNNLRIRMIYGKMADLLCGVQICSSANARNGHGFKNDDVLVGSEDTGFICRGCFSLTVRNFLNLASSKTVLCNSIGMYFISVQDQYVFLHQAVMEALVCGNTEIIPQDLRIATNKLAKVHKPSKKTGYERELKASDNYSQ